MAPESFTGLVAGGGSIGRRHAENLQELGVKVAVADPDEPARSRVNSDLGVDTYRSVQAGLDQVEPDFVVVAAPNHVHVNIAMEATDAGCHLFVEKPLSHDMAGVDDLQRKVRNNNLVTLVGCNFRFNPAIRRIHELLVEGTIGRVLAARIEAGSYLPEWFTDVDYREAYSAREDQGGGVILDYIHEINYARWLLGEFETVSALTGQKSTLDVETNDVAAIIAETTEGTICEFHLDYVQRAYSRSCHIVGEEGTIRWSWPDERVSWYVATDDTWYTNTLPAGWEVNDMYLAEMDHFLKCIDAGESPTCPVECGRHDLAIALAARQSAETGRHVGINRR